MDFAAISDEALLSGLSAMIASERQLVARVVAYLLEVQDRRLDLKAACSSLFDFCTRRLGMSEGEAFRRINAARLVRKFPRLLTSLERGEIHLSALVLLRDHLTDENWEELVGAASRKSKRDVQELLAARFPKADAPTIFRLLPSTAASSGAGTSVPAASAASANGERRVDRSSSSHGKIEPLSPERYKLQLTTSRELHDKIERATRLMRHRNPTGDLATVLEQGIDLLIAKLEKERLGKSEQPRKARGAKHGYVTRAARRDVFARDGEQCSFVGEDGQRCAARAFLEIDHVRARARGGCGEATNLQVLCRAHNLLLAEQTFGRHHVEGKISTRRGRSAGDVFGRATPSDEVERQDDASGARSPARSPGESAAPARLSAAACGHHVDDDDLTAFSPGIDIDIDERSSSVSPWQRRSEAADSVENESASTSSLAMNFHQRKDSSRSAAVSLRRRDSRGKEAGGERWERLSERAAEGLVSMGFRVAQAWRALDVVHERTTAVPAALPPIEQLLREALAVLC